jgi:hypothetical protein
METLPMPSSSTASKADLCAKGDGGQQRQLVARVDAAHVEVGVGLQIAQLRGLPRTPSRRAGPRLHPGQDVVAGAVHHAHHAAHLVAGQPFGQGLDDGDAACDGRLEADHAALRLGRLGQRLAVMGEQRLVGGDHILARGDGGFGRGLGGAVMAAHHLDEHIHIVARASATGSVSQA